jgi:S-methylmethionine-dependent homocysteine/selenocysteine methylase
LLGYSPEALAAINAKGIELYREVAAGYDSEATPVVLSGCIGPRGDAYRLDHRMSADEAQDYHAEQVATLQSAGADQITGVTLSDPQEAIGLARAAMAAQMPVAISFTLDAEARLATGPTLAQAIAMVDVATDSAPAYYMINCTHPNDFAPALQQGDWIHRLRGILPNASPLAKGVLCQLGHLEEGDPAELGRQMGGFARRFPHMNVWGGCCGTDHAHLAEICRNVARRGRDPFPP